MEKIKGTLTTSQQKDWSLASFISPTWVKACHLPAKKREKLTEQGQSYQQSVWFISKQEAFMSLTRKSCFFQYLQSFACSVLISPHFILNTVQLQWHHIGYPALCIHSLCMNSALHLCYKSRWVPYRRDRGPKPFLFRCSPRTKFSYFLSNAGQGHQLQYATVQQAQTVFSSEYQLLLLNRHRASI